MAMGDDKRQSRVKPYRADRSYSVTDGDDIDWQRFYRSDPLDRIELIRRGIPVAHVGRLAGFMGVSKKALVDCLQLSLTSITQKERAGKLLSRGDSERILGVEKIIGMILEMVEQSGNLDDFDSARWIATWFSTPVRAFGGARPWSYMDTFEGQELVQRLLAMSQSGAYA